MNRGFKRENFNLFDQSSYEQLNIYRYINSNSSSIIYFMRNTTSQQLDNSILPMGVYTDDKHLVFPLSLGVIYWCENKGVITHTIMGFYVSGKVRRCRVSAKPLANPLLVAHLLFFMRKQGGQ